MSPNEIAQLMPAVFQRTLRAPGVQIRGPLDALLDSMSALHERAEQVLGEIDRICDPHRTYDAFVPFLAGWVDLERIFRARRAGSDDEPISSGTGNLRQLVAAAPYLVRWRGTRQGLVRFLEIATGIAGFQIDELPGFHLRVRAPAAAADHQPLIERILNVERPAYCTWDLVIEPKTK